MFLVFGCGFAFILLDEILGSIFRIFTLQFRNLQIVESHQYFLRKKVGISNSDLSHNFIIQVS